MNASMRAEPSRAIGASILVVEDSDEDFDTLIEAAHAAGQTRTICRAFSGDDCLAMLRSNDGATKVSENLLPALIFMDLNSHGADGREALVLIKNDPWLKEIPLVVLTTSSNPKDLAFCMRAGANAYHVKPVRYDQYLLLLGSVLHYWLQSGTLENLTAGAN